MEERPSFSQAEVEVLRSVLETVKAARLAFDDAIENRSGGPDEASNLAIMERAKLSLDRAIALLKQID
jgi:hypothetical protein